jgi:hypothetical protein
MKILHRLLGVFAVAAIAGALLSTTGPAEAAPVATTDRVTKVTTAPKAPQRQQRCFRKCFGAISMSPDQAWGGYRNTATRRAAITRAHKICKRNSAFPGRCTKMGWVRNGCMAVAIKTNSDGWITDWASGFANTKRAAVREAKNKNNGGRIRAWLCTAN